MVIGEEKDYLEGAALCLCDSLPTKARKGSAKVKLPSRQALFSLDTPTDGMLSVLFGRPMGICLTEQVDG